MPTTTTDVRLRGPGPFQLPAMRSVVSLGEGTWDSPSLRLETQQGAEVWIPLEPAAVEMLYQLVLAWRRHPQNPLNRPGDGTPNPGASEC